MAGQTILFRGDGGVAVSVEITRMDATPAVGMDAQGASWALLARFHPERAESDATATSGDADELADLIEDHVEAHYREAGSRLRTIRWTETREGPIMAHHLGRYGVPLLALDTGRA